jgi:hypothetical protein
MIKRSGIWQILVYDPDNDLMITYFVSFTYHLFDNIFINYQNIVNIFQNKIKIKNIKTYRKNLKHALFGYAYFHFEF